MTSETGVSRVAIDLTQLHRRTVTSFYSNLVTRPTGRAVRTGVESQLAEIRPPGSACLSVLDFSQVRLLDYSCADEIVAKLLLRYAADDRPGEVYFVAMGLQEHHLDAVEAVLERHSLLLVTHDAPGERRLLGPTNPVERACWGALGALGEADVAAVSLATGLSPESVLATLGHLAAQRAAVRLGPATFLDLSHLAQG